MQETKSRMENLEQRAARLADRIGQGAAGGGMQQMAESLRDVSRDMTRAMDRVHQSLQDPQLQGNRDMQRDVDRLHKRLDEMAKQMEGSLQLMERMDQRLREQAATPGD